MTSTLVESPMIGLERIAQQCLIVLIDTLNDELPRQDAFWLPLDEELAEKRETEVGFEPIKLEPVELSNFYTGHIPSLINAPIDRYPNVAVDADRAGAAPNDDFDQISMYAINLYVEFMVKSEKTEEEVNARAQRMLDAVNTCVMGNRTLRGSVQEMGQTPSVQMSDTFTRREKTSYGDKFFWRGGRIEYSVRKAASMPSGDFLRSASVPDIDQS